MPSARIMGSSLRMSMIAWCGLIVLSRADWKTVNLETPCRDKPALHIDESGILHFIATGDSLLYSSTPTGLANPQTVDTVDAPSADIAVNSRGEVTILYAAYSGWEDSSFLKRADYRGSGWDYRKISSKDAWSINCVYDQSDTLHCSYMNALRIASSGRLYYHKLTSSGFVDSWMPPDEVYDAATLAVDPMNHAHLAFYFIGPVHGLFYQTNSPDGVFPAVYQKFDEIGGQMEGMNIDIVADTNAIPHVVYNGVMNGDCRYATLVDDQWDTVSVATGDEGCSGPSIAIDNEDALHIAYFDNTQRKLMYGTNTAGTWTMTPIADGSYGYTDIGTDNNGYVFILWSEGELHLATDAPLPTIAVHPGGLDFGEVGLGKRRSDTVHVYNSGDVELVVDSVILVGADKDDFSVTGNCTTLGAGDSCMLITTFAPSETGNRYATLRLHSNDPLLGRLDIRLYGRGGELHQSWAVVRSGPKYDNAECIRQTSDGGYIIAGSTTSNSTTSYGASWSDIWVAKCDRAGHAEWEKVVGWPGEDYGYSVVESYTAGGDPNGYIVAGTVVRSQYTGINSPALLVKFDRDGNIVWQKAYGGEGVEKPGSITRTGDNRYLVAVSTSSFGMPDSRSMLLLTISGSGRVTDETVLSGWPKYAAHYWNRFSIQPSVDGGRYGFSSSPGTSRDSWIIRTDSTGAVQWKKDYDIPAEGRRYYFPQAMIESFDTTDTPDGFVVAASRCSTACITKISPAGSVRWEREILPGETHQWVKGKSVLQSRDRGYVVIGTVRYSDTNDEDIVACKFDFSGTPLWQRSFGGEGPDVVNDAVATDDGGMALCGIKDLQLDGLSDGLVLKLDSLGRIPDCPLQRPVDFTINELPEIEHTDNVDVSIMDATVTVKNTDAVATDFSMTREQACLYTPPGDTDKDGISSIEESGPGGDDPAYDGNGDGTADSEQNNAVSFHGGNGAYVTVAGPDSIDLANLRPVQNPDPPGAPDDVSFAYDFFSFAIEGIDSGAAVTCTLYLPDTISESPSSYWKNGPQHGTPGIEWYEFDYNDTTGAEIVGHKIALHFVDGMRGDSDLDINGRIEDPGAPGWGSPVRVMPNTNPAEQGRFSLSLPNNPRGIYRIHFTLATASHVQVLLTDIAGREITSPANGRFDAGNHTVVLNQPSGSNLKTLPTGLYFLRFVADGIGTRRKVLLIR